MKFKDKPLERLYRSLTTENLWIYILSLLLKEKKHGYIIANDVRKIFEWEPGFVTPYIVLYKLEKDGYIKSRVDGRRKYYKITRKGRKILKLAKRLLKETSVKL